MARFRASASCPMSIGPKSPLIASASHCNLLRKQNIEPYRKQTNIHHPQSEEGKRPFED